MCNGIFGSAFDFNNDGILDAMEQGAELGFLCEMMEDMDSGERQDLLDRLGVDPDELDF